MSRFFNTTRTTERASDSGPQSPPLAERIVRMKQAMEAEPRLPEVAKEDRLVQAPVLTGLPKVAEVAESAVSVSELDNCRRIRLPRDDEKSLLTPEYNLRMQHASEAYQTLRTRLLNSQSRNSIRSLIVSSASPGEGKTLTTFNLALSVARMEGCSVLLVDADLRTGGLSALLGNPSTVGLGQILEGGCSYESAILQTDVTGLYVLPAGDVSTSAPELFSRAAWKDFVRWSSSSFKLVLIDSPPMLNLVDFELIAGPCESILVVARAGRTGRESLAKAVARLDPRKLAGVVLNGSQEVAKNSYYDRYRAATASK